MKKYLLFDLDGTLTDPKVGITTCVQYALQSFGIEEPDLDKLEPFIGPPLLDSFMQYYDMDQEQASAAVAKYRERFQDKGIFENEIYKGIPQMLRKLQDKGYVLAVASSKPTVFVQTILTHFGIRSYFDVVVGSELDGTRVNKDEVVRETLARLSENNPIQLEDVYMIGDRKFDVEGARAFGVESIGVSYGYGSPEELEEAGADYIVHSVEELEKFLLRGSEEPAAEEKISRIASGQNPNPRGQNPNPRGLMIRRIWTLAFTLLLFIFGRRAVVVLLSALLAELEFVFPDALSELLYVRDGDGKVLSFTAGVSTIIMALGYIGGMLLNIKMAKEMIAKTAVDRKPAHVSGEPVRNYLFLGAAVIGGVVGLNLLFELLKFTTNSESYQAVAQQQYASHILIGILCYGLITPVAEEVVFRGVIFNCLRRILPLKRAALIGALVFGLYHGNVVQGIYGLLMGLLIIYGYEYFGNFAVPVGIHMAANIIVYCLTSTSLAVSGFVSWPVCIAFLAVAVSALSALHWQKKDLFA